MKITAPHVAVVFGLVLFGSCQSGPGETQESKDAFKQRMMEAEKRMKESMPKTQEIALKQKVDPETLNRVQQQLATLKEYLGDEARGVVEGEVTSRT